MVSNKHQNRSKCPPRRFQETGRKTHCHPQSKWCILGVKKVNVFKYLSLSFCRHKTSIDFWSNFERFSEWCCMLFWHEFCIICVRSILWEYAPCPGESTNSRVGALYFSMFFLMNFRFMLGVYFPSILDWHLCDSCLHSGSVFGSKIVYKYNAKTINI